MRCWLKTIKLFPVICAVGCVTAEMQSEAPLSPHTQRVVVASAATEAASSAASMKPALSAEFVPASEIVKLPTAPSRNQSFSQEALPAIAPVAFQDEEAVGPQPPELSTPERLPAYPTPARVQPYAIQPKTIEQVLSPPVQELMINQPVVRPISLSDALALAGGESPQIALASARYREAYARLSQAKVLWLPSLRAGASYHHHDGNLQDVRGAIVDVDRSSLQAGMGVGAVGAGTSPIPGVYAQFHTADAIFQPKINAHATSAQAAATRSATNDTLLATALAYLELLRTTQELRIAEETAEKAEQLFKITNSFANAGQGPRADADRAQVELFTRRSEILRAQEAMQVAAARLAELVRIDPTMQLDPQEPALVPIELVEDGIPLNGLVATGLSNRPELSQAQSLVCEAVERYNREKYAPLVPSVLLGVSQSGFAGGVGSTVASNAGRFDFDAGVYWELRNFGFGEKARREETQARYDQARFLQVRVMDQVAREVVECRTQVVSRRERIGLAEQGIVVARSSYERNLARINQGEGLPIEALQSLQAFDGSRREYVRSISDYNEAQFRLQRALGWPIQ